MLTDFQYGDIIEFCGEQFKVLSNCGDRGMVEGVDGTIIDPFRWEFQGEKCKLVKRKEN